MNIFKIYIFLKRQNGINIIKYNLKKKRDEIRLIKDYMFMVN